MAGVALTLVLGGVAAGAVYWTGRGTSQEKLLEHGLAVSTHLSVLDSNCTNQQSYLWRCRILSDQGGQRGGANVDYLVRVHGDCWFATRVHTDRTTRGPDYAAGWLKSRENCFERIAIK